MTASFLNLSLEACILICNLQNCQKERHIAVKFQSTCKECTHRMEELPPRTAAILISEMRFSLKILFPRKNVIILSAFSLIITALQKQPTLC